jgi:hypothetical protein
VLVANNLNPKSYYPGSGGMSFLLRSTEVKPRPLDGFCMEGGLAWRAEEDWLAPEEEDVWHKRMKMLLDANQSGLAALPILAGAGAKSDQSEPDTPERDRIERFGYASYLLCVEQGTRTMMGTYAFYQSGGKRFVKVHRMYYYPIGDPAETVAPKELDKYRGADSSVYQRHFTNGLVLVNPSTKPATVKLDQEYLDPDNGQRTTTLTMPSGTGKILLKKGKL